MRVREEKAAAGDCQGVRLGQVSFWPERQTKVWRRFVLCRMEEFGAVQGSVSGSNERDRVPSTSSVTNHSHLVSSPSCPCISALLIRAFLSVIATMSLGNS